MSCWGEVVGGEILLKFTCSVYGHKNKRKKSISFITVQHYMCIVKWHKVSVSMQISLAIKHLHSAPSVVTYHFHFTNLFSRSTVRNRKDHFTDYFGDLIAYILYTTQHHTSVIYSTYMYIIKHVLCTDNKFHNTVYNYIS